MRLSVVVPANRETPTLPQCLAAINTSAAAQDELIVVDDPDDASPAELRNRGAARASGDILVFIDADVIPHGDAIEKIRAAFAEDPLLDGVFGCYDDASPAAGQVSRFRNLLHHHVHMQNQGLACTFWSGLGAIKRETFLQSGGFDPCRYPSAMIEDVELGLRIVSAGGRIELRGDILGTHLKRWTLATMVNSDLNSRGVPWMRLILEQRRAPATLNLAWRQRFSAAGFLGLTTAPLAGRWLGKRVGVGVGVSLLAATVALNHRLYALLLRHGGIRFWLSGLLLHGAHNLAAVTAVPVAVAGHLRDGSRSDL